MWRLFIAIFKAVNCKAGKNASLKGIINYVLQPQKTEEKLITGICCDVPKAFETFMDTKVGFEKLSGRQYYHWVQSFPSNENITAQQAHELAIKFIESCKKFRGFEILVVTHKDRDHIHTHFIMNSVSFVDGHKFHINRQELAELKEMQNKICIAHGFSAAPKKGFDMWGNKRVAVTANNARTYRLLQKSSKNEKDSYLIRCYKALKEAIRISESKQQFIQIME
ncbi:MAG: relaxase/mobilization nuclease domain-containing protein, partial [Treponema sp.]|nr:relaxase/mobilization nuclease domain-containing protein [Treponema sp.]